MFHPATQSSFHLVHHSFTQSAILLPSCFAPNMANFASSPPGAPHHAAAVSEELSPIEGIVLKDLAPSRGVCADGRFLRAESVQRQVWTTVAPFVGFCLGVGVSKEKLVGLMRLAWLSCRFTRSRLGDLGIFQVPGHPSICIGARSY